MFYYQYLICILILYPCSTKGNVKLADLAMEKFKPWHCTSAASFEMNKIRTRLKLHIGMIWFSHNSYLIININGPIFTLFTCVFIFFLFFFSR